MNRWVLIDLVDLRKWEPKSAVEKAKGKANIKSLHGSTSPQEKNKSKQRNKQNM